MAHMRRQQKDISLAYDDIFDLSTVSDLQHHIALYLIEKLFYRIIVKVDALIRPANDHHHHAVTGFKQLPVGDRWLQ